MMIILSNHNLAHNLLLLSGGFLFLSAISIILIATTQNITETRLYFFLNGIWDKAHSLDLSPLLIHGSQTMYKWQQIITTVLLLKANQIRLTNIAIVSIVVVFFPIAAFVNAFTGGSPFLLNIYLSLAIIFGILMLTGEIKKFDFFNQLLSFMACFGILVFVPIYVTRSFTHTILTNGFYQSFVLSFIVAIFWYVAVFCLWQFIEFVLPNKKSIETIINQWVAPFLCVVPFGLILTFIGLFLGQIGADYPTPPRSWTLLLSSVAGLGLSYSIFFNINSHVKFYINSIISCLILSSIISYFIYFMSFQTYDFKSFTSLFFGFNSSFNSSGDGGQLTSQFWIIHLPQIPIIIYMFGLFLIALMKLVNVSISLTQIQHIPIPMPLFSTAVVLFLLAIPQLILAFYS